MNNFHSHAPDIKYVQDDVNTFCLTSLESTLSDARGYVTEKDVLLQLK